MIRLLKLALKAKNLPEASIIGRVLLAIVAVFVLIPVGSSLRDPSALSVTDYIGLVVFAAVGVGLLRAAIRRRE